MQTVTVKYCKYRPESFAEIKIFNRDFKTTFLLANAKTPFSYWSARDGNSECTGVVNLTKIWRQKDIHMGKSQKDMCPFSYLRAREGSSKCTGVVNLIKVWRQKSDL